MGRLDELKKQRASHDKQETSEKDYAEVVETLMNRPGESKLINSTKEIVDIDVNSIDTDEINEQLFGYEDLEKIEQSFDTIGNNSVIYVYRRKNGRYLCFAGNQRLLATRNRKEKIITCVVAGDEPSEAERIENYIFMNSQRTPRPYYIARQLVEYEKLLRRKKISNITDAIEEKFGYKGAMQRRYKQILKLDDNLQELFKRDDIPFGFLLDKCSKIPEGKEIEFVQEFNKLVSNEEISTDLINQAFKAVVQYDKNAEKKPSKQPIKTSKEFKELISLPYYREDDIQIPTEKKDVVLKQAKELKIYIEKIIDACSN